MDVGTSIVRMPDFKMCIADGISAAVENSSAQVKNGSDGGRDVVVDDEQIIVSIQRQIRGVIRALSLFRRCNKRFRKNTWNLIERCSEAGRSQPRKESSSSRVCIFHACLGLVR